MHLTPREFDKLIIHTMADVALKRKAKGLKLNHPETVAVLCQYVLEGAREAASSACTAQSSDRLRAD
jgi:urease subunit gamma